MKLERKESDFVDEALKDLNNKIYSKGVIGDKSFLRDNPDYMLLHFQGRILSSQAPKWMNIASFTLLVVSVIMAAWALLHSYNLI